MNFQRQELIEMIYALGEADKNCLLASRIYQQKFPNLRHPRVSAFEKLKNRFEATGNVTYSKPTKMPYVNDEEVELSVLLSLEENPHLSSRKIAAELPVTKSSVNRITLKHKFHPYHIALHQDLYGNDFVNRVDFCNTILDRVNRNPNFLSLILFSDEATFKNNGIVNRHNMHYYATENPHWVRQVNHQHPWSINVWGGIFNSQVIGPFFSMAL